MAIFDLAKESAGVAALEKDVEALDGALAGSADLRDLIASPVYSRDEQSAAMTAVAAKMGVSTTTANALKLMAANRRLFVLPQLTGLLRNMIAADKGEITAEVTSATALSKDQADKLAAALRASAGKTVKLKTTVDESLIGGLVVKLGSKMIDTSIRSKLAALQNSMKEVG